MWKAFDRTRKALSKSVAVKEVTGHGVESWTWNEIGHAVERLGNVAQSDGTSKNVYAPIVADRMSAKIFALVLSICKRGQIPVFVNPGFTDEQKQQVCAALEKARPLRGTGKVVFELCPDNTVRGVTFSEESLVWLATCLAKKLGVGSNDVVMSTMPLHDVEEQMITMHLPTVSGCSVFIPTDLRQRKNIAHALTEAKPTIIVSRPRLWEKIYQCARFSESNKRNAITDNGLQWCRHALCLGPLDGCVRKFFTERGLDIMEMAGFLEAGGFCGIDARDGNGVVPLCAGIRLVPGNTGPSVMSPGAMNGFLGERPLSGSVQDWRRQGMAVTSNGTFIPCEFISLCLQSELKWIRDVHIFAAGLDFVGALLVVDGDMAAKQLHVPLGRIWRNGDVSDELMRVVKRVNERLPTDCRVSRFTHKVVTGENKALKVGRGDLVAALNALYGGDTGNQAWEEARRTTPRMQRLLISIHRQRPFWTVKQKASHVLNRLHRRGHKQIVI